MPQMVDFVGVDVSKSRLDVCVLSRAGADRYANDPEGWARLIESLPPGAVVGVEPSGGYERGLVAALLAGGVEVRWADPMRVRALARALGAPAKTDAIDAAMIARYLAQAGGRAVRVDPDRQALRALLAARSAALEAAIRLKAQAKAVDEGPARQALERLAGEARREVMALARAALAWIGERADLAKPWPLMQTAPGVGPLVAAELLAHMPELGQVGPKAIAKLAGLAPFVRESGAWRGRAACSGGRPRPRQILYLAAMAALRACPRTKAFVQALTARGKPKMVALNAAMRKLLVSLNAMLRDQQAWQT